MESAGWRGSAGAVFGELKARVASPSRTMGDIQVWQQAHDEPWRCFLPAAAPPTVPA